MIQSSRYHRLMTYVKQKNLLPLCFESCFTKYHKVLDFYAGGLIKERVSSKIVNAFEICDPSFFTTFRDCIMHMRHAVFDELFTYYIPHPFCDKGRFVCLFVTECYVRSTNNSLHKEDVTTLLELMNFILNCMFLAGCDLFFHVPSFFHLTEPDKHFQEKERQIDVLVKNPLWRLFGND
ncbi:hypothetical protein KM1_177110 [Entamoeba histolytica HM-3:IMSS]|uniref:Uncharacterized protein n=1 Tax=Entamoeba histolytica HM-3:IMSS TaxID=885315 RepID=M7W503_ENTHI|nr:hypothetical protein KM1_177110 [Entamoeba histolytica HM-3:IMSS]